LVDPVVVGGKYRIVRPIGKGGMGAVFEAVHTATGKRVALKIMHLASGHDDPEEARSFVARFEREVRFAGSLETQHIARVFDAGMDGEGGRPFMAMELLDGEDLHHVLRRLAPMPTDLALRIVAQACVGLERAHEAGIVHRDIKPSNLFLAKNEFGDLVVKVLDFGIAKGIGGKIDVDQKTLTETGTLVGSPHYMSPEQSMGLKALDARADVWSLGIVLYKCLTGRTPYDEYDALGQVIMAVNTSDAPSVQDHAPWIPPEIARLVRRALRREPEERFEGAKEMLVALRALLPEGMALHPDMLRPLSGHDRTLVARRGSEKPTAEVRTPPSWGSRAAIHGAAARPKGVREGSAVTPESTDATLTRPAGAQTVRLPRGSMRYLAAGIVAALVAGGAYYASVARTDSALVAMQPRPPAASQALPPPPPPPSAVGDVIPTRTVRVGVAPPTATVIVDGHEERVEDGVVTLSGALGSTHHVTISSSGMEKTEDVAIAESGAVPGEVRLQATPAPARPVAAGPSPTPASPQPARPRPATSTAPSAKPARADTVDRTFE
jgi:serine/threonine-protein kinase